MKSSYFILTAIWRQEQEQSAFNKEMGSARLKDLPRIPVASYPRAHGLHHLASLPVYVKDHFLWGWALTGPGQNAVGGQKWRDGFWLAGKGVCLEEVAWRG